MIRSPKVCRTVSLSAIRQVLGTSPRTSFKRVDDVHVSRYQNESGMRSTSSNSSLKPASSRREQMPSDSNHRRSKRILLEIVVLIKARTPGGNSLEGQGFTRVVNAHGGMMDAPFRMMPGQHFTLVNPRSKQEAWCSVVRIGCRYEGFFPISFEFSAYDPQFWGVSFAPADWFTTLDLLSEG
jgi:hypothetical protein